jgi:hypothetical protein
LEIHERNWRFEATPLFPDKPKISPCPDGKTPQERRKERGATLRNWPIIKDEATQIFRAIDQAAPGSLQFVECGRFRRTPG